MSADGLPHLVTGAVTELISVIADFLQAKSARSPDSEELFDSAVCSLTFPQIPLPKD